MIARARDGATLRRNPRTPRSARGDRRRGIAKFLAVGLTAAAAYVGVGAAVVSPTIHALVPAGGTLTVNVPEAVGGKTVFGNLAVDQVAAGGFVTAYGCADGLPMDNGQISRADLNYSGDITPVWSNRLIVQADANGDICFYTSKATHLIIDINGVTETGITPIPNQRTDTRGGAKIGAGKFLEVNIADAVGGQTVFGNLAVDQVAAGGFVTAYGCADGLPMENGQISRADLNYSGDITPVWSNRLIVQADANGDICFYTSKATHLIIDINGVTETGITPIPNERTDTRSGTEIGAATFLQINVADAVGGKSVFGNLAVDQVAAGGFVTAYGCVDGLPMENGQISRADLNYSGDITPVWSNRLIVQADANGDICFYTSQPAHMIIDINGVTETGITPIPNQRTETRDEDYNYLYCNPISETEPLCRSAGDPQDPLYPYTRGGINYLGWDPCSTITYAINANGGATVDQRAVLDNAIFQVEQATGFDFVFIGEATGDLHIDSIDANTPNGQAEAVFAFSNDTLTPFLSGGVIGVGGAGGGSGNNIELIGGKLFIVKGGYAIADMDDILDDDELLATFLHEIGHMVGLDHVIATDEVMYSQLPNPPRSSFNNGDKNGLHSIGASQCANGSGSLSRRAGEAPASFMIEVWRADHATR